ESSLGDLRLVRRVGRVPARVLENAPADDRWSDGVVIAETDHRREQAVAPGKLAQLRQRLVLTDSSGQGKRGFSVNGRRHGGGGELLAAGVTDDREHLRLLVAGGAD